MIQAPQTQYIPNQQQMLMPQYQQPAPMGYNVQNQQPYQQPGVFYNYPTASCYPQSQRSQFNGVNIELINPQGLGVNTPQPFYPAQPMMPSMPSFYPNVNQGGYPVQQPVNQLPPVTVTPAAVPADVQVQTPQAPVQAPVQQPVNPPVQEPVAAPVQEKAPEVPQPQIKEPEVKPEIKTPVTSDPSLAPEAFAGRLKNTAGLEQKAVIEDIATKIQNDDTIAPSLLDTQIFDALVDVIDTDTSALQGPSPEVIALRQKDETTLTEAEKQKAMEQSPLEIAEQNKEFSLYTISYMQQRLNNELEKFGNPALELKDLPCIDKVIMSVKENPNPAVRIAALSSLAHIARPEYKADLNTVFELAKQDEDVNVQTAAEKAIAIINQ